jgi:hypothetical protein
MIIEKEFNTSWGKRLSVELPGANVDITGWDQELVSVKTCSSGRDDESGKVNFYESSKGVEIHSRHSGKQLRYPGDFKCEIKVPKRFDLEIKLMAGRISINNVAGHITGISMAGDLNLRALKGALNLETMAGNISLLNSEVSGQVKTMAGQVVMQDVSGNIKGSSMAGDVIRRQATSRPREMSDDEVRLALMAGNVNVGNAPAGADLSTMAGNIHVQSAARHVKARTNAGNIRIDRIDGWIQASTLAGGVSVTMVGQSDQGKRHVEINAMGGVVELTVPVDLSMQVEITLAQTIDSDRDYRIISDFSIQQSEFGKWLYNEGTTRKYLYGKGSLAGGKNKIIIKTVNGDVYLKKGS